MVDEPSDVTLERAAQRALAFIRGVRRHPVLQAKLAKFGYNDAHHQTGWQLLGRVVGIEAPEAGGSSMDRNAVEAEARLMAWDDMWLPIADVTLAFDAADQHAFLFAGGLKPVAGPESSLVVKRFLDRYDILAGGRDEVTRDADAAAVALLAEHGLDAAVVRGARADLAVLTTTGEVPAPPSPEHQAQVAAAQREAEVQLWRWVRKWTTIARRAITRRDHLVWLGLAERKRRAKAGESTTA